MPSGGNSPASFNRRRLSSYFSFVTFVGIGLTRTLIAILLDRELPTLFPVSRECASGRE